MSENDKKISEISEAVASFYDGPVTLQELQGKLLYSPFEVPGPTPPRDEKIYSLVYNFLQARKDQLTPEQLGGFAPLSGGAWICCGREIAKLLAQLPNTSLKDLLASAKEHGYQAEVVSGQE